MPFDPPDIYGVDNLNRRDNEDEIARSILNNGFLAIGHDWPSNYRRQFINYFNSLGASRKFINELENMFNYKADYEDPRTNPISRYDAFYPEEEIMSEEDIKEGAWDNMRHQAKVLDKIAKRENLYQRMKQQIMW